MDISARHRPETLLQDSQFVLNQEGINVLQWPLQSSDLNPIKILWGILKRVVAQKIQQIKAICGEVYQNNGKKSPLYNAHVLWK